MSAAGDLPPAGAGLVRRIAAVLAVAVFTGLLWAWMAARSAAPEPPPLPAGLPGGRAAGGAMPAVDVGGAGGR